MRCLLAECEIALLRAAAAATAAATAAADAAADADADALCYAVKNRIGGCRVANPPQVSARPRGGCGQRRAREVLPREQRTAPAPSAAFRTRLPCTFTHPTSLRPSPVRLHHATRGRRCGGRGAAEAPELRGRAARWRCRATAAAQRARARRGPRRSRPTSRHHSVHVDRATPLSPSSPQKRGVSVSLTSSAAAQGSLCRGP